MPASSCCSHKIVFFGNKITLIYENWPIHRFWMTRSIIDKKNDFSVLKCKLFVKTYQWSFHYFRRHPRFRIRKVVNISWAWRILKFLKTARELTLPDDNGLVHFFPSFINKKTQLIVVLIFSTLWLFSFLN